MASIVVTAYLRPFEAHTALDILNVELLIWAPIASFVCAVYSCMATTGEGSSVCWVSCPHLVTHSSDL